MLACLVLNNLPEIARRLEPGKCLRPRHFSAKDVLKLSR